MPSPEELIAWLNDEGILDLPPEFPADGDLFSSGMDSMAVMQLVVAVEERFGVVLDAADLTRANLSSPRRLAELIGSKSA